MKRSYVLFALLAGAVLGRLPLPVTQAEDPPPGEVHTCGKPVAWEKSAHDGKRLALYASGVVVELDQAAFDAAIEKYEGK